LSVDATHQLELFVAGSSLTAWVTNGSSATNLTPRWPRYDATAVQWLRIRESGGTVFFEYAGGSTSPGAWTVLTSTPKPFSLSSVTYGLTAGSDQTSTDTAIFDNVSTT
jgi:hypothetical protein